MGLQIVSASSFTPPLTTSLHAPFQLISIPPASNPLDPRIGNALIPRRSLLQLGTDIQRRTIIIQPGRLLRRARRPRHDHRTAIRTRRHPHAPAAPAAVPTLPIVRSIARARLAGRGAQFQGAQGREVVAAIGEEPPKDDGVELVEGGGGGDDDPDVLFEAGPEPHDRGVPWSTC